MIYKTSKMGRIKKSICEMGDHVTRESFLYYLNRIKNKMKIRNLTLFSIIIYTIGFSRSVIVLLD